MKAEILNQQFKQGDLTWVEIHESSWWPAQVVDEGHVSAKPLKKFREELLVRLYGSYEYVYVDASKSNCKFEDMLKRENKTMKEKFLETLEQDMSLMLSKGQPELSLRSEDVSKGRKQQSELTKEATGKEADIIATAMKVCTNKVKKEGSSKRKQKLDASNEEKETLPMAPKAKTSNSKKQKVAKQSEFKNHDSSILRQFPCFTSVENIFSAKSVVNVPISENKKRTESPISETQEETETPIFGNQDELKARDLEIRRIVRDVIFGGLNNPAKIRSPKVSKDTLQGSRKVAKNVVSKISGTPKLKKGGSSRSMESNAEEIAAELPSRGLKGKGNRDDKTSNSESQKKIVSNSKLVEKKIAKGYEKAKNPDLEAKTPEKVKDTALMAEERGLLSERQVRVMQNLGLIAPAGSPFGRIIS